MSASDNDRRSKRSSLQRCALRKFYLIEGPNARDQIALGAFRLFLVDVQTKLSIYVPYLRCKNNCFLEGILAWPEFSFYGQQINNINTQQKVK